MNAEGWYVDPFTRHEARWFSNGEPTALVRDGDVESHDEPPGPLPPGEPVPVDEPVATGGDDLVRVDDTPATPVSDVISDAIDRSPPG